MTLPKDSIVRTRAAVLTSKEFNMATGLLLLRLTLGLTFAAHGGQKLFGWFGGLGLDATGRALAGLGFRPGRRHALMAGVVELAAGLLLAVGLVTPLASLAFVSVMLVAALAVHSRNGFFITEGGYEYTLVMGAAGVMFAFTGPGDLSLDAMLGLTLHGLLPGLAVLALGLIGGAIQLAQRSPVIMDAPEAKATGA
jgi:putative oxidoreductase